MRSQNAKSSRLSQHNPRNQNPTSLQPTATYRYLPTVTTCIVTAYQNTSYVQQQQHFPNESLSTIAIMGAFYELIPENIYSWILQQKMFFVATAPLSKTGHVNVSPKGGQYYGLVDDKTFWYMDLSGSGVETISHLRENARITVMFQAFEGSPRIVRLWGVSFVLFFLFFSFFLRDVGGLRSSMIHLSMLIKYLVDSGS